MRRILVVGGGIAGVEGALTLSRGLGDAQVTLLAHGDVLRVTPDLVYVPGGVSPSRIEVPLRELFAGTDVTVAFGELERIDVDGGVARTDVGELDFDLVACAPGATPLPGAGLQLQSLDDAYAVRDRLDEAFAAAAAEGARSSIVIRAAADDAWSPPAYELAAMLAARRRALGLDRLLSITLVTAELTPFQWFEPHVADAVTDALDVLGVELATGVPEVRFDDLEADVIIDFGPLEARVVPGLPGRAREGWYATDADGRVHERAFVLGDAASHGFKAPFAIAWQARRMLAALGGSLDALGRSVGGVPVDMVEHHVDLAIRTLRVRVPVAANLGDPWLGHVSSVEVEDGPPDRLAGLLVGEALHVVRGSSAAAAHRALVTRPGSPLRSVVRGRLASRPTP